MAARFCVEGMDKDAVATVGIHSMRAAWEDADVLIDGHAELAVRDELDTTTVLESPGAVLYDDGKDKEDKELLGAEKEAWKANGSDVAFKVLVAQERKHSKMRRDQRLQKATANTGGSKMASLVGRHCSAGSVGTDAARSEVAEGNCQHGQVQEGLTGAQTPQRRLGGHRRLFRGRHGAS